MSLFEPLIDTTAFLVAHLASLIAFGASAWIFGETVLRRVPLERPERRWPLAGALGWGLILQTVGLLGFLGWLERWLVLGLLALGHLLCLGTWRSALAGLRRPGSTPRIGSPLVAGGLIAVPLVAATLYPATGFDATVYHLPYARAFIDSGGLEFLPDLRFPIFPQAGDMGFVLGFFLSGEIAAKLTQLLATWLTAGLLLDWGGLHDRRAGTWAAALWLGNPLVVWLGTNAYVDATLALFVTAAFLCWELWLRAGDRRWLWLAGAFTGLAAGTKYLGLFFLAALAIMTAWRGARARDARPLAVFLAFALAVLGPWYLRIVYHTGNPVFPFYAPIFGASEWASLHDQALPAGAGTGAGALGALWAVGWSQVTRIVEGLPFLAMVPWTAIFDRGVFHWQAPLSPWYLLLVPLCAPVALLDRRRRRLLVVVAVYGLFWLTTVRDLRFLLAGLPALNVTLAATLAGRRSSLARKPRTAPLVAVLLVAPGVFYAGFKCWERGLPPIGADSRDAYLSRQVPGFPAIRTMNRLEGRDYTVYALYAENLRYYAEGRFLGERFGPARYSLVEAVLADSGALAEELRSWGACFFLVRHPRPRELLPVDATFRRHFREHSAGDDFVLYRLPEIVCSRDTDKLHTTPSLASISP